MSLFVKFNLILVLVFAVALVPAAYLSNQLLQTNAARSHTERADHDADRARDARLHEQPDQAAPRAAARGGVPPQSVPAYSATEIFNNLRESNPEYTYKEATLNPTNPRDRTVDWEADFVNAFRADPKLTEVIGEREGPLDARCTSRARSRSRTRAVSAATRLPSSRPPPS